MARPAPSVERTVSLLTFLADRRQERFSLSDLARRLGFNKATCHAMLTALVEQGMLIRHPYDRTYMLGPELVNLGTAAVHEATEALDAARSEFVAIRDELDVACVALSLVGDDIVTLDRVDVDRENFGFLPIGSRSPARLPDGAEFYAWARGDEIDTWLSWHDADMSDERRNGYFEALNRIRITGCQIAPLEHFRTFRAIISQLTGFDGARELEGALNEVADDPHSLGAYAPDGKECEQVLALKAPVFGPSGRVVVVLAITCSPEGSGRDLGACMDRLLRGTRRITESLDGHEPFPQWARPENAGGRLRNGAS